MNVIQCNVARNASAQKELLHHFSTSDVNVLLIQEPYHGAKKEVQGVYADVDVFQFPTSERHVKACVIVKKDVGSAVAWAKDSTPNLAIVQLVFGQRKLFLTSAYVEPEVDVSSTVEAFDVFLKSTSTSLHVVGMDANGHHPLWGSDVSDGRGENIVNVTASNSLSVVNVGSTPTFQTVTHETPRASIVDVTLASESAVSFIDDWRVDVDVCTLSDHNAISFSVKLPDVVTSRLRTSTYFFNNKTADWGKFESSLTSEMTSSGLLDVDVSALSPMELDHVVVRMTDVIRRACFASMKLRGQGRDVAPWWTPELDVMKTRCSRLHHRLNVIRRGRQDVDVERHVSSELKQAKAEYKAAVSKTSQRHFRDFCSRQGKEDVWSLTNRLIKDAPRQKPPSTLKTSTGFTTSTSETATSLLNHFYPDDDDSTDTPQHQALRERQRQLSDADDEPPFTDEEIRECLQTMNPNRAPGPDNLTSDIVSVVVNVFPTLVTSLMNRCLDVGHFPTSWKTANVKILQKPGRDDYSDLSSYRPIGLLPVFGKLLEKLFVRRLTFAAQTSGAWSQRQFGFREQTSAPDALRLLVKKVTSARQRQRQVVGVSLDIKAAFDNAWWPALHRRLRATSCPRNIHRLIQSYLQDRQVTLDFADVSVSKTTSKGCVQGSVCGPTFWNVILDELLDVDLADGCHLQAYADDVMLLVEGTSASDVEKKANTALSRIHAWGVSVKLTFSASKTSAIAFTPKSRGVSLVMDGVNVDVKDEVKLLGVILDERLTFIRHAKYVINKVTKTFKTLCKYVRPTWGVSPENVDVIYRHVIEPTVTYAAGVWGAAAERPSVRKIMTSFQRQFAIRCIRGFHTVSGVAASALADFVPLHLKVREVKRIEDVKTSASFDVLPDVTLESRARPEQLLHPAKRVNVSVRTATSQADADRLARQFNIYTDGSKQESGATGCAVVIYHPDGRRDVIRRRLADTCSVFQAEMLALDVAVTWASENATSDVSVFSDSQSALAAIADRSSKNPLVVNVHKTLASTSGRLDVQFVWVKAHIGILGNEAADAAANDAATDVDVMTSYTSFPLSLAKHQIRQETLDAWAEEFATSTTGSSTRALLPTLQDVRRFVTSTSTSFELTQFLSGHCFHRAYLHRFKLTTSASCPCGADVQDVNHLVTSCPRFEDVTSDYRRQCDVKGVGPLDLANVIKHPSLVSVFTEVAHSIVTSLKTFNQS